MGSKLVNDRIKSATSVSAGLTTHATAVGAELQSLLAPHAHKGEHVPDVALLFVLLGRALKAAGASMTAADLAHEKELGDDDAPRRARDADVSALRSELVDIRGQLVDTYGEPATRECGFTIATPEDPVALETFAAQVIANLRTIKLPSPRKRRRAVDVAALADDLEPIQARLAGHIADVAREAREAEATLARKNQAIAAYDRLFTTAAGFGAAGLNLAGQHDLGGRLRPAAHHAGQTSGETGEPMPPDPTAPGSIPIASKPAA
jgi:hypothetical protein